VISWNSGKPIRISIVVDDVPVTGEIVLLTVTDMAVAIVSPVSAFGTGLHVPYFAAGYPPNQLATESGITERGPRDARDLPRELFLHVQGRPSGWGHPPRSRRRNVERHRPCPVMWHLSLGLHGLSRN
jgi:hypothetical protein